MASKHQPDNDARPDEDGILEELEDTLRIGFEGMAHDISPIETDHSQAKFTVHFEYRESSVTPDPNIMVPDDNTLWFMLFEHFIDRCNSWRASIDDPDSIELLLPFVSNQDKQSPHPEMLYGTVDEQFVECIMQNAQGAYGQIRWFNFSISSTEIGFFFTTEHNGTEFIVTTNDLDDVNYLKKTVPKSMSLNIWPRDDDTF